MILEFSVQNFKSIREKVTLSFEASSDKTLEEYYVHKIGKYRILKMIVLFGPNASGKTNILEALNFLCHTIIKTMPDKKEEIDINPNMLNQSEPSVFDLVFFIDTTKYVYHLELNKHHIILETLKFYPSTQPALLYKRVFNHTKELSEITFYSKSGISPIAEETLSNNTLNNMALIAAFGKTNIESKHLNNVYNWFSENYGRMVLPKTILTEFAMNAIEEDHAKEFVLEQLCRSDFNISDIKILKKEIEIDDDMMQIIEQIDLPKKAMKQIEKQKKIPIVDFKIIHEVKSDNNIELDFSEESLGTQRYFGISALLYRSLKRNRFLPIDEIESSLHYDLVRHFILTFLANSHDSQLVFSTHTLSLLAEKDIFRKDSVWLTDKKDDGSTDLFSLLELLDFRKDSNFYKLYKAGRLGAKPITGSIFLGESDE